MAQTLDISVCDLTSWGPRHDMLIPPECEPHPLCGVFLLLSHLHSSATPFKYIHSEGPVAFWIYIYSLVHFVTWFLPCSNQEGTRKFSLGTLL